MHIVNFLGPESKGREPVDWQMYRPNSADIAGGLK
jgi:hypothetical protein